MLGRIRFVTYQNCGSDSTGTTRENVNVDCPLAPPVITGTTMRTADEFTFAAAIGDCVGHRKQHGYVIFCARDTASGVARTHTHTRARACTHTHTPAHDTSLEDTVGQLSS